MTGRRWSRGVAVGGAAVLLAFAGAGCGIPEQGSATKVDDDRVPYQLLDRTSGGTADSEDLGSSDAVIYLARGGQLVPTARSVPSPLTLERLLRSLGRGPTSTEALAGIRTALPGEDNPTDVTVQRGTATVDLPASFTDLSQPDQVLALAQIVYTVTGQPGIGQVQFTLDGTPADIPRADLSLTAEPVTRDDYLALAPPG